MSNRTIQNAKIGSTMLGVEGHGVFTFMIHLDYGGAGQGFGGYSLDTPLKDKEGIFIERIGTAYGMTCIMKLLECLEVESWEQLKGIYIRADAEMGKIHRIGHLLKDQWFSFEDVQTELEH